MYVRMDGWMGVRIMEKTGWDKRLDRSMEREVGWINLMMMKRMDGWM